jgi:hypothetical protein
MVETHDLLSDANDPSSPQTREIEWSRAFTVTLSGKNHIDEAWRNTRLGVGARPFFFGQHGNGRRKGPLTTQGENSTEIGASGGKAVWHVLGEKKLQRIFCRPAIPDDHEYRSGRIKRLPCRREIFATDRVRVRRHEKGRYRRDGQFQLAARRKGVLRDSVI